MKKTALVIMAAGLGSRFGQGIKQLSKLGPGGEIIMDYSVYDAVQAGFDRIVFIIRRDIEKDFREIIGNRIEKIADTSYCFQEKEMLPEGFSLPEGRVKPWGTAHALLSARPLIDCPFAVINADDFYGKEGFSLTHKFLLENDDPDCYCMAGYRIENTLSDNGAVNRGLCLQDDAGFLKSVEETYEIREENGLISGRTGKGEGISIERGRLCSMNMFGLSEKFLDILEDRFPLWLEENIKDLKSEYLLPNEVNRLVSEEKSRVKVLEDHDRWFGVTYQEDRPLVEKALRELSLKGIYPPRLFN